ncbi:MAG: hypothetical protein AB7G93_12115 [Bdellovibrionales bacterium]
MLWRHFAVMGVTLVVMSSAQAEIKDMNAVMSAVLAEESVDLETILDEIQWTPVREPGSGQGIVKVTYVEKGSVWEQKGIKVGDLLANGTSYDSGQIMQLKGELKPTSKKNSGSAK